jgi:hypothetical protein
MQRSTAEDHVPPSAMPVPEKLVTDSRPSTIVWAILGNARQQEWQIWHSEQRIVCSLRFEKRCQVTNPSLSATHRTVPSGPEFA